MFKIENDDIFYIQEPMTIQVHYGKVYVAESTEIKNQLQVKKFNIETGLHEHCDELTEFEYNGKIYPVENGFFTVEPTELIVPTYVPTQLDRIESLLLEDKAGIQQEAIDNYTLELIESGVL